MAVPGGKKISAASARSHTRKNRKSSSPFSLSSGLLKKLLVVLLVGFIAWSYQAIRPPPPKICGSPDGPPITSPRITLKDGRHLSYMEAGVPKQKAKYKVVFVHGFKSCKKGLLLPSKDLVEELGIYVVSFDRSGYGESDPHPEKTEKSIASDIEELADRLELGSKFYVIGHSMGGMLVWNCLKYMPHRLAGAALVAPVQNYWWPGFPRNLSEEAFNQKLMQERWALRVAHYAPWLTYWWNSQKLFPGSASISGCIEDLSIQDRKLMQHVADGGSCAGYATQQGVHESLHRDLIVHFGSWEFDPVDLENPFKSNESSVHLWQGVEDRQSHVTLLRYVSQKLPWIHYHEIPDAGHLFPFSGGMTDEIYRSLLLGDK